MSDPSTESTFVTSPCVEEIMKKATGVSAQYLALSSRQTHTALNSTVPEKNPEERIAHAKAIAAWEEQNRQRMVAEAAAKRKIRLEREEAESMWRIVCSSNKHDDDNQDESSAAQIIGSLSNNNPKTNTLNAEQLSRAFPVSTSILPSNDRAKRFIYLWSRFGPPSEARRRVWISRIGNKLAISPDAFESCLRASRERVGDGRVGGGVALSSSSSDALSYIALDIPRTCIVSLFEQRDRKSAAQRKQHLENQEKVQSQQQQNQCDAAVRHPEQRKRLQSEASLRILQGAVGGPPVVAATSSPQAAAAAPSSSSSTAAAANNDDFDDGFCIGNRSAPPAAHAATAQTESSNSNIITPQRSSASPECNDDNVLPSSSATATFRKALNVTWALQQEEEHENFNSNSFGSSSIVLQQLQKKGLYGGRFFPSHEIFREELELLLRATVEYLPEIGYVQGVSYLASMLLNFFQPNIAFVALCNLLKSFAHLPAFYTVDHVKMSVVYNSFKELLAEAAPDLAASLSAAGVEPSMYLYNWLQTLYCRVLPLPLCIRLWDLIVLDEAYILRIAIALVMHFDLALRLGDPSVLRTMSSDDDNQDEQDASSSSASALTEKQRQLLLEEKERRKIKKQSQRQLAGLSPGMTQDSCLTILTRVGKYKVDAELLLEAVVMNDSSSSKKSKMPSLERIAACVRAHEQAAPNPSSSKQQHEEQEN